MSTLPKLIDHLEWADAKALAALRGAARPDAKVREIYSHILGSEHTWIARIEGRTPSLAVWPTLGDGEIEHVARENVAALRRIIEGVTEVDLARVVAYRNSAGHPFESTVEDILLHVALHGSYHRGQVAMLLRQGGTEPAPTDYIAFIRGAPAATRASVPQS
ncbi:MAG TPA: DinB family protein [Gemmatimonadaceae bacterium]|nr:DinB family protein [Gemmatimonadaceae bacterium]